MEQEFIQMSSNSNELNKDNVELIFADYDTQKISVIDAMDRVEKLLADREKSDQLKLLKFAFFRLNGTVPEDKLLEGCVRDYKGDLK